MVHLKQGTLGVSIHVPVVPAFHTPATNIPSFQSFPVMGKSNFLDVSDRFGTQTMEENSSSISPGFLIILALLPLSFLFFT